MTQERKAVKAKFFFDNGDEVTVLTKDERERECMSAIARATMCKRDRDGNMEEVIAIVRRSIHTRESIAATPSAMLTIALRLLDHVFDDMPEEMKPVCAAGIMQEVGKLSGGKVISGTATLGIDKQGMNEALGMVAKAILDGLKDKEADDPEE